MSMDKELPSLPSLFNVLALKGIFWQCKWTRRFRLSNPYLGETLSKGQEHSSCVDGFLREPVGQSLMLLPFPASLIDYKKYYILNPVTHLMPCDRVLANKIREVICATAGLSIEPPK